MLLVGGDLAGEREPRVEAQVRDGHERLVLHAYAEPADDAALVALSSGVEFSRIVGFENSLVGGAGSIIARSAPAVDVKSNPPRRRDDATLVLPCLGNHGCSLPALKPV